VLTNGNGSVVPNYDGHGLEIGKSFSISARPGVGFAFENWSGSLMTNVPKLSFVMNSNLTFEANFVDVMRPVCTINYPMPNRLLTNAVVTLAGKARDNAGVTSVYYQLNGNGWNIATTTNSWNNWTANLNLSTGINTIQAYAMDATGRVSLTNMVKVLH
jgi:hypothetical protein